ncbi:ImmA/IrrE family metallo-endopeptidase [Propionispora hippei]|uniref:IrrE N-terminal-like domain-containing protein n=1 Tax=Propionispora hippei DSM 15287 TaxID=1123003 RepID=A0A1M6GHQ0_9FIRM|nr:hypothetical protein [Propionispora hippei]SHJ09431.1 hypothetical protein SAMN02745170_01707 [Propionispora hippei DSM 15287]
MERLNSFRDVIEDRLFNEIFNALLIFVEDNPGKLEGNSHCVESPDEATLSDVEVKLVDITDSEGNEIFFDVVVSAEIEIAETVKRNRETDGIEQWFRISCSAELEDGFRKFYISDIHIYNKYNNGKENHLSEYLVPIIRKDQLDDVAEEFLKKYYPEALAKPMAVPAREVAKRMGIDVQEVHITKTCSVFGQTYFSDCEIQYYDRDAGLYKPLNVKRGTILVDPNVYFMRNVGSMNNTIIHECVHWDLHKKFFELEKLYNKEARSISCQVQEGIRPERNRTPLDWMEWHANSLAPRILMPVKQTRQKIEELIAKNKRVLQNDNIADIMESVVFELSEFFEVSRIAAKIRMIDLGYTEAIGVYTYIDDHYILNYAFERAALKNNQTFTIGMQDALYEYATNVDFKKLLNSGKYVYIDAHFCINDSKYIRHNENGYAELTDYARQHIDECCLIFDLKTRKNNSYGVSFYTECVLYKNAVSDTIVEAKYSNSAQNQLTEARAAELKRIKNEATQTTRIMRSLPATFSDTLVAHMDRLNFTVEYLEEMSLVNAKTIQRMRNDDRKPHKLPTVVAICIGMQLNPVLSADLIKKAGHTFRIDEEHIIYQMLLNSYYQNSIYECNEILRANDCNPLSKAE